jgi:hypothetical protein
MSLDELQSLKADCKIRAEMVEKSSIPDDIKRELSRNLYPLLEQITAHIADELDAQGEALEELIDQSDNILHPEMTAQILGVFELGKVICAQLEAAVAEADDVTKKRISDLIMTYRRAVEATTEAVRDITSDLDEFVDAAGDPIQTDKGDEDDSDDEDESGDHDSGAEDSIDSDEEDSDDDVATGE